MTASDKLRQMVREATDVPWMTIDARIGNRAWAQVGPTRNQTVTADVANLTDAHLIALAPQLAELLADMAEVLEDYAATDEDARWVLDSRRNRELLARLDILFEKETT